MVVVRREWGLNAETCAVLWADYREDSRGRRGDAGRNRVHAHARRYDAGRQGRWRIRTSARHASYIVHTVGYALISTPRGRHAHLHSLQGQDLVLDGEFWAPNKRLQKQPKVKPDIKMEIVDGFCVVTIKCVCARAALSGEHGSVCAFLKTYTLHSTSHTLSLFLCVGIRTTLAQEGQKGRSVGVPPAEARPAKRRDCDAKGLLRHTHRR